MMLVIQSDQHFLSTHTILKGYSISCPISCVCVLQVEFASLSCFYIHVFLFFLRTDVICAQVLLILFDRHYPHLYFLRGRLKSL